MFFFEMYIKSAVMIYFRLFDIFYLIGYNRNVIRADTSQLAVGCVYSALLRTSGGAYIIWLEVNMYHRL